MRLTHNKKTTHVPGLFTSPGVTFRIVLRICRFLFDWSGILIGPRPQPLRTIKDIDIPPLKLRLYKPARLETSPYPVFIFFHGGGWMMGSIRAYDRICQYLSRRTRCLVVSVEYRRAPEYKFPCAVEDALHAYRWVTSHLSVLEGDWQKIIVGGDSAGGNLAAVIAQEALRKGLCAPILQVLIYPVLNASGSASFKKFSPSWYRIFQNILGFYLKHYAPSVAPSSSLLSPGTHSHFKGAPETILLSAEWDILTPQIEAYQHALEAHNIPHHRLHYRRCVHGFMNFAGINKTARKSLDELAALIRHALIKHRF